MKLNSEGLFETTPSIKLEDVRHHAVFVLQTSENGLVFVVALL